MRSIRTVMRELTIKILNAGSVREDAEQNLSFKIFWPKLPSLLAKMSGILAERRNVHEMVYVDVSRGRYRPQRN